ncbi:MAG: hypothetical protein CMI73_01535 [Candidatus Pelagibacter sp.]|nr:hypothetical protein [Candidatus Pelagibacter sp.]OUV87958.1 MAG: hypothetical protein CBC96_01240 [Pelagibacteraceae bacterium TMED136]|tara:strand:+ start:2467 stop:3708 length:1242 start_codon:yes stop_codon:yes gene_type:complete
MKRLFIFEPECSDPLGHSLNSLRQYSIFFKKKLNVYCITNASLKKKFFFKEGKILNIISFKEGCFKIKDFFNFTKNLFFFIYKIFSFVVFVIYNKSLFKFISACTKLCFVPRYIPDLYRLKKYKKINNKDSIFIPSGRPHILQSILFLYFLDKKNFPTIHFRIVHPVKYRKNRDNFFKYLDIFENFKLINKKIFFYAENNKYKETLERFHKFDTSIFNGISITKSEKSNKNIIISFLGESKNYKGFYKIPKLIKILQKKYLKKLKFIIQISKRNKEIHSTSLELRKIALLNKNVKIIEGSLDNLEFEKYLSITDIMPLLHPLNRAKTFGSGFIYTCMGAEIIMIIPKGASDWKKVIPYKSYLEADSIDNYVKKIDFIINNLNKYNRLVQITKKAYLNEIKNSKLIKRILKNEN